MSKKLNKIMLGLIVTLFLTVGTSDANQINTDNTSNQSVEQIQESTITRVVEGDLKKVSEEKILKWEAMNFNLGYLPVLANSSTFLY